MVHREVLVYNLGRRIGSVPLKGCIPRLVRQQRWSPCNECAIVLGLGFSCVGVGVSGGGEGGEGGGEKGRGEGVQRGGSDRLCLANPFWAKIKVLDALNYLCGFLNCLDFCCFNSLDFLKLFSCFGIVCCVCCVCCCVRSSPLPPDLPPPDNPLPDRPLPDHPLPDSSKFRSFFPLPPPFCSFCLSLWGSSR